MTSRACRAHCLSLCERVQKSGEKARGEMSIVGYLTIEDHNASLGASSSLPLPKLMSQLRGRRGFGSADSVAILAFSKVSRGGRRERADPEILAYLNSVMQNLFLFFFYFLNEHRKYNPCT